MNNNRQNPQSKVKGSGALDWKIPDMTMKLRQKEFGKVVVAEAFYLNNSVEDGCFIKVDDLWSCHNKHWNDMRLALGTHHKVWVPVAQIRARVKRKRPAKKRR